MENKNDLMGSKWRKWDLHVHSKYSKESRAKLNIKEIFENAIKNNIEVLSITDHSNVDGLDKIWEIWENEKIEISGQIKKICDLVNFLPGIELKGSCGRNGVHFIAIFPKYYEGNRVDTTFLLTSFLAKVNCTKSNIEKVGKGDYARGLLEISVDLKEASKIVHELDGIIIVHNGRKDHSLDEQIAHAPGNADEYELLNTLGPEKNELMEKYIDVCEFPNFNDYHQKEAKFYLKEFKKPCVVFSDSHTQYPENNNFTWIKADPTFSGLKQIIYEPDCRIFLGEEPEIIRRVRDNKTKYIKSICINNKSGCKAKKGEWFQNVELLFNKELVAIIGNKGSGKSALSDVIGLLGNTHNAGENNSNLTFLNNSAKHKKFRQAGFADRFEAELFWEDGSNIKKSLDSDIDQTEAERVRYLPQNYFESITNDLEEEKFEKALRGVIFSHVSESDKQGRGTFDELERYRSLSIKKDLALLEIDIKGLSTEIVSLEKRKHKDNEKIVKNLLEGKKRELDEHEKNKPAEVKNPTKDESKDCTVEKEIQLETVRKLNADLDAINKKILESSLKKNALVLEKEDLQQILGDLKRFKKQIDEYKRDNRERCSKHGINIDEIIIADFVQAEIENKIGEKEKNIAIIESDLCATETSKVEPLASLEGMKVGQVKSLVVQKNELVERIEAIKNELSKPEKEYEEYIEKFRKWEALKKAIIGDEKTPATLEYYEKELEFIKARLPAYLSEKRGLLIKKASEIFRKKKEIILLYREFKSSIDKEIEKDGEFHEKFKMNIDVSFKLDKAFVSNFLNYINKNKKGTFYGKADSDKYIAKIFEGKDLSEENEIQNILENILEYLEQDQREGLSEKDKRRELTDQIDQLESFYEYVFCLDYLEPKYELRQDDKTLSELSPGEKGVLLLVFYLMIDKEDTPLIIDQPEDNLDNESVYRVLTHFIRFAKNRRQIIIVTHNPNLAIGADAEQIIRVNLNKQNDYVFTYEMGAIENPDVNKRVVDILEGTMPAFTKRRLKYMEK